MSLYKIIIILLMQPNNETDIEAKYLPFIWTIDFYWEDQNYYTFLKKVYRHELRKNWFKRITIPFIENLKHLENIFWDKINKYVKFEKFDWMICPNIEIWVMRAYLNMENKDDVKPLYFYNIWREFLLDNWYEESYNISWQIIWEDDPILDALMIYINYNCLKSIWLKDVFEIHINSTWVEKEKVKYSEELINFYSDKKHLLSENSLKLLEENPFKLLDSKEEDEMILADEAPKMTKFLRKDSKKHYAKFKEYLELLNIDYIEDHKLFWEDFYQTNSIWNFQNKETKDIFISWYRYNWLSEIMWAEKNIWATWFWANVVKIISLLKDNNIKIKNKDEIDLYFVQLWDEAKKVVLWLSIKAREAWINTTLSLWTPSIKDQMLKATRIQARFIVMVWVMEARNWIFQVRKTCDWTQEEVKKDDLIHYIKSNISEDRLDFYCPAKDLITS